MTNLNTLFQSALSWRLRRLIRLVLSATVALVVSGCMAPTTGDGNDQPDNANQNNANQNNDNVNEPPPPIDPPGIVRTIAGTGAADFGGDGGAGVDAMLNQPMGIGLTTDDALLIADFGNHRIRRLDLTSGLIDSVAGTGVSTGLGAIDSPAGVTTLADSGFLAISWRGQQVFEYDMDGNRIRAIGSGQQGCPELDGTGAPNTSNLDGPRHAELMADGSILISLQGCRRVMRATKDSLSAYAGTGASDYSGDDGLASEATFQTSPIVDGPAFGISLSREDPPDELFIADTGNNVVRRVRVFSRRIDTFAGNGDSGFKDGAPLDATFDTPTNVFLSGDHSVWVVDTGNHAVRHIDPFGLQVTTIIGTGEPGFNGDGLPAIETQLDTPTAVWVTNDGVVYVADSGNHRIRRFQIK